MATKNSVTAAAAMKGVMFSPPAKQISTCVAFQWVAAFAAEESVSSSKTDNGVGTTVAIKNVTLLASTDEVVSAPSP